MIAAQRTAARETRALAIPPSVELPRARVILQLAGLEVKKLLTHPAFLGGLGVASLLVVVVTGGGSGNRREIVAMIGAGIGLAGGTLLGANACALRVHRERVGELLGSLASPPATRTAGLLLAVLAGPVVAAIALAVLAYPVLRSDDDLRPWIDLALLAQYPLTVAALGAFGVALARWIKHPIAGGVALVAHVMTPLIWAVPWIVPTRSHVRMDWHYAYLVSAIVFWASIAFAGDRRRRMSFVVAGGVLAVTITSAVFQVPPGGFA